MAFESHAPNIQNLEAYLNEEKSKSYGSNDGPVWWNIPSGMSSVRILPPWDPSGRVALAVNMHPIEYQGEGMKYKKYNWTCVNRTFGKPCPICEGLSALAAAGVDISKYEATRRQFYMNAIVMYDPVYQADINAGKKPEDASGAAPGTHVVFKAPKTIYDWVIAQITNPMVGDITSLTNGIDIYITKEGSGLGTKYTPTLSPNGRGPVPQEYLDKIESLYNLDEIFNTGFDEKLINELVSHLKKSAGVVANTIPGVVNQMAGYPNQSPTTPNYVGIQQQVPPMNANPHVTQTGMNTNPYSMNISSPSIAPSPYESSRNNNLGAVPKGHTVLASSSPTDMNLPKCYGNYNPAQVNCVVCPAEVSCSQNSR